MALPTQTPPQGTRSLRRHSSTEKMAVQRALEKNPKTVHKALKYMKASVANQRALFGSRARTTLYLASRQEEFAEGT
ncbi:hypothetical protein KP79_PYT23291 [Mizuhopecten yessoensis]|uniref:Uncharacterized protein n=1 Tax=Mizuhopecten yessoensis TaxID=6573 RepID=A0A210PKN0_MIZYE|nr:hypothetical protein KP79_PYT02352 [Mizuhopecten yessoensis]OWF52692.1 hypothetical protein KP79_PYT23291 [Mizuhopecten yessoensis]